MIFKVICAASWLMLLVAESNTTTEHLFLVRNLDGSQGDCTLDATVTLSSDDDIELEFGSNECSEMQTFYFFVANDSSVITEARLYANSTASLIQYSAPYVITTSKTETDLNQTLTTDSTFKGQLTLNSSLLPNNPTKYNLAVLMTGNVNTTCSDYLSYYYLINAAISLPDLMVLDKYKVFGLNQ